jgi:hypothetical protein
MTGDLSARAVPVADRTPPDEGTLVLLDGRRLLHPDGSVLVELAADGAWRTPDGSCVEGLALPEAPAPPARGAPPRDGAQEESDAVWMTEANMVIGALAERMAHFTSDDVWAALEKPPRESRMIGNALSRARSRGLIAPTSKHRPSGRKENHGRQVRIWSSLRYGQQSL